MKFWTLIHFVLNFQLFDCLNRDTKTLQGLKNQLPKSKYCLNRNCLNPDFLYIIPMGPLPGILNHLPNPRTCLNPYWLNRKSTVKCLNKIMNAYFFHLFQRLNYISQSDIILKDVSIAWAADLFSTKDWRLIILLLLSAKLFQMLRGIWNH